MPMTLSMGMNLKLSFRNKENIQKRRTHFLRSRVSSTYRQIQGKVVSRFHVFKKEDSPVAFERELYSENDLKLPNKKNEYSLKEITSLDNNGKGFDSYSTKKSFEGSIYWTRGRFVGTAKLIVLRNGVIVEKVFSTPKGTNISVKRKDLGIFVRMRPWLLCIPLISNNFDGF